MQIYLDYSATTPLRSEAIAVMQSAMTHQWGNPSSLHHWGNRSATVIERARMQVASLINAASSDEIVFTAGGTEADNLAIFGVARQVGTPQHMIISAVEHSAVAAPIAQLAKEGWQITYLPVDQLGKVSPDDLRAALQPNTALVSVIYAQSEVGTLQPIEALGQMARDHGVLFHSDAVQVAGRLPIDVQQLPVDLLSVSSHKLYGPQGAGALYVRQGTLQTPLLFGGGQEQGLRAGTQAVATLAGFGCAAELALQEMPTETLRLIHLRDRFFNLMASVEALRPTGDARNRLPHHVSFCLPQSSTAAEPVTGKTLVRQMNLAGIGISAGSACHSGKLSPSPILKAMGYDDVTARSGIRLTLGKETAEADVDWSAMVLKQILARTIRADPAMTV